MQIAVGDQRWLEELTSPPPSQGRMIRGRLERKKLKTRKPGRGELRPPLPLEVGPSCTLSALLHSALLSPANPKTLKLRPVLKLSCCNHPACPAPAICSHAIAHSSVRPQSDFFDSLVWGKRRAAGTAEEGGRYSGKKLSGHDPERQTWCAALPAAPSLLLPPAASFATAVYLETGPVAGVLCIHRSCERHCLCPG